MSSVSGYIFESLARPLQKSLFVACGCRVRPSRVIVSHGLKKEPLPHCACVSHTVLALISVLTVSLLSSHYYCLHLLEEVTHWNR